MKTNVILWLLFSAISFLNGCATGSGTVLKSESTVNFLGGEISIGNTIYNISGEDSANIIKQIKGVNNGL